MTEPWGVLTKVFLFKHTITVLKRKKKLCSPFKREYVSVCRNVLTLQGLEAENNSSKSG